MRSLTFAVTLVIATAFSAKAQTDEVKTQLAVLKLAALSGGWEETHNDKISKLNNRESDSFTFNLYKGNSYKIVSVCDNDCSDLDLVLYDENQNEISRDNSRDSIPIVEVTPAWSGEFKLKVVMFSCSANPCLYGISILGK